VQIASKLGRIRAFQGRVRGVGADACRRTAFHYQVAIRRRLFHKFLKEQRMVTSKIRYLAAVATGLLAATANAGALSQMSDGAPSRVVRFGDLDLTTQKGVATLQRRIANAAREVCPQPESRDLSRMAYAHACQNQAIDRAVRAIGNPMLADRTATRQTLPH
jgi:UrcA family protein